MAESKMPARIWALPGATRGYWSPTPSKHPNSAKTAYIRADLVEPLVEALQSIRQYGSDTLSGRADGPDDRQWQRESVLEMTRRAALSSWEAAR